MRLRSVWLRGLFALLFCVLVEGCSPPGSQDLLAERRGCERYGVSVIGPSAQDVSDVCLGVSLVAEFFRELGLAKTTPIAITVVQTMPAALGPDVLGCFSQESRQIQVLGFEAARARGSWLGRPMDRPLYRSLAAHEVAHALASCNATGRPLSLRAREYVAYAVMFATMDPDHRAAILSQTPGPGFEEESQITDVSFHLAPYRFGLDAYRHYLRPQNGTAFLRRVIRGAALRPIEE